MHNWLRLLLLLAMVNGLCSMVNGHAQTAQDALYIYRNDGGFNAFFYRDIQRIAYSKVDTLGVEQADYVVQEVYAMDSVFRIPVSAIDSISFVTPETKYKADVAHTTESDLWNYVIATDSVSWLLLRSNTPTGILPKVGDKLLTLNQTDLLPAGFIGRVAAVQNESGGIRVSCGAVELTEVFDQYVGRVAAIVENSGDGTTRIVRREPETSYVEDLSLPTMANTLHLTESVLLSKEFSIDGNGYMGLAVTPTLNLRAFLAIDRKTGVNFDMVMHGEVETQLQFGLNGIVTGTFDVPLVEQKVPIPNFPIFFLKAEAGVFTQAQGSLNIGGTYTSKDCFYSLTQFNSLWEGSRQATATLTHVKDTLEWSALTGKVTLNAGAYAKLCIEVLDADIAQAGVRVEAGLREEVEADLKFDDYKWVTTAGLVAEALRRALMSNQQKARALYDDMDRNVSVNWALFLNGQALASIGKWQVTTKIENTLSLTPKGGLVPHLTKPTYRLATAATDSVYLNTQLDRNIAFPVKVGYDIYNAQNLLVREAMRFTPYTGKPETLTMGVAGLEAGKKYMAYPRVDIFGLTMYGEPTDSFTTDKPQLDIPVKSLVVDSNNGNVDVKVNTNVTDITFSSADKWITYFWNEAQQVLTVYYDVLPSGQEDRKGTIKVVTRDGDGAVLDQAEVSITQVRAVIDLSTTELKFGVEGGASVINITSTNCKDLKATTTSNFLHPSASGNTVSILADPNTSTEARRGTVVVSGLLESVGVRIERFISVTQDGTMTPQETRLFDSSNVTVNLPGGNNFGSSLTILGDGTTSIQGDYIVYKSADTKVESSSERSKSETSWQIQMYIDPKDNNMMRDYELVSGSVSYLNNYYYKEGVGDKEKDHKRVVRCSFNVKDLPVHWVSSDRIRLEMHNNTEGYKSTAEASSDFSFEEELDGTLVSSCSQAELNAGGSIELALFFAEGVPVIDAISLIETDGRESSTYIGITRNDVVQKLEITTSHDWLTTKDEGGGTTVSWTANTSKADREGYVYLTGTMADGSTIIRTITVRQTYDRIWDDE